MAATVISFRPAASLGVSQLFRSMREKVQQMFPQSTITTVGVAEANSDIWLLYRMAGAHDSVSPAVMRKLGDIAASK